MIKTDNVQSSIDELTEQIIAATFNVGNKLGCGFLEKVYENALVIELSKLNFKVSQQYPIAVIYDNVNVGDFYADIIVNELVILELKSIKQITDVHRAQCLNYLKATQFKICLLINFGNPKIEIKRIVNQL
jgi:GxxExxY protein